MVTKTDLFGQESRRSLLKKAAFATGSTAGLVGTVQGRSKPDTAANETQTDTKTDNNQANNTEGGKALMFLSEFRGGAQFKVTSSVIKQHPTVEGVQEGNIWSEYNTRMIEYLNTNEDVTFFPAHDAEVEEGQVYELHDNFTWFGDDTNDEGIIDVKFTQVDEEQVFDADDFEVVGDGGGKALVRLNNFRPGAVFTITSGVVEWVPREDVEDSDIFSAYNTRFAEWFNTNNDFQIYPAHDAEIEKGAMYRMNDEFDMTDPQGNLVTVDLDRVENVQTTDQETETATEEEAETEKETKTEEDDDCPN